MAASSSMLTPAILLMHISFSSILPLKLACTEQGRNQLALPAVWLLGRTVEGSCLLKN
jgi:hypothetical protein